MGGAESRGAGADCFHLVLFVVARLKLWLILMACRAKPSIVMDYGCPPISYLGLKATCQVLNHSKTVLDVITVRFDRLA